jgi:hypothetical protein
MLLVRLSFTIIASTVVLAATGYGSGSGNPGAARVPAPVDITKLDTGNFRIEPGTLTKPTQARARMSEGQRLATALPLPLEIDPHFTFQEGTDPSSVFGFTSDGAGTDLGQRQSRYRHPRICGRVQRRWRLADHVATGIDIDPKPKFAAGTQSLVDTYDYNQTMSAASSAAALRNKALFGFSSGSMDVEPYGTLQRASNATILTITVLQFPSDDDARQHSTRSWRIASGCYSGNLHHDHYSERTRRHLWATPSAQRRSSFLRQRLS